MIRRTVSLVKHAALQLKGYALFGRRVGVLGDFTVARPENVRIGPHCGINHGVYLLGHTGIDIGSHVVLSAGAMLIDAGLKLEEFPTHDFPAHVGAPIVIGDGAWIGAGAIILGGVTVGRKAVVGAGAVVNKDVPPFGVVVGNPARLVRTLELPVRATRHG